MPLSAPQRTGTIGKMLAQVVRIKLAMSTLPLIRKNIHIEPVCINWTLQDSNYLLYQAKHCDLQSKQLKKRLT